MGVFISGGVNSGKMEKGASAIPGGASGGTGWVWRGVLGGVVVADVAGPVSGPVRGVVRGVLGGVSGCVCGGVCGGVCLRGRRFSPVEEGSFV